MAAKSWYIFCGSGHIAFFGEDAGVGVGETQAVLVVVVCGLQPPLGLRGVSEQTGDQTRMIVAKGEDRAVVNAVKGVERVMEIGLTCIGPGRKQRCRDVARARRVGARQVGARRRKLSLSDIVELRLQGAPGCCSDRA